ncbi:MAG: ADP-glyceromanno-heptose 6-epimerase [Ignavibacteriae bacterium]|nr:ADP-glyceromanno-heptose 6-epimerase [Ignavibacteriota bacterium]
MIVLTGGAGFIGSCFLDKLNIMNRSDILVVDHLGEGNKWKNLVGKKFLNYKHKSEFRSKLNSGFYGKEIEAIIHFGACSSTTELNADYLLDNNFSYSVELAEFALANEIRFIYASSAATYGSGEQGYSDNEFEKLNPLNIYGYSKHLFDLWVINKGYDKIFTGLKFFNVFGPNEYHKGDMASMVYKSFCQVKETGKVRLFKSNNPDYKDGEQKRDFVYVMDCVNIIWDILNKPDFAGIYNLGTGTARTWNDLANAVFSAMKLKPNFEYIEMPASIKNQYQNFTQADMGKLKATGLKVEFRSLEESVKDYIENHLLK